MRVSVRIRVNEVVHCGSSARRFAAILADGGYGHLYLEDNESQFGHSCGNGVILFLFFFCRRSGSPNRASNTPVPLRSPMRSENISCLFNFSAWTQNRKASYDARSKPPTVRYLGRRGAKVNGASGQNPVPKKKGCPFVRNHGRLYAVVLSVSIGPVHMTRASQLVQLVFGQ